MNPISDQLKLGTLGELLVQLRLLQFDVQAAPPLKDSGNDLIAVRGDQIRAIQVKSTTTDTCDCRTLSDRVYHLLAFVRMRGEDRWLNLDDSKVFLIPCAHITKASYRLPELAEFQLTAEHVDALFPRSSA
jgi:hypothetical protein